MKPSSFAACTALAAALLTSTSALAQAAPPGKQTDIVAVPGNPLSDITAAGRVSFVMKGGTIYKLNGVFVESER